MIFVVGRSRHLTGEEVMYTKNTSTGSFMIWRDWCPRSLTLVLDRLVT